MWCSVFELVQSFFHLSIIYKHQNHVIWPNKRWTQTPDSVQWHTIFVFILIRSFYHTTYQTTSVHPESVLIHSILERYKFCLWTQTTAVKAVITVTNTVWYLQNNHNFSFFTRVNDILYRRYNAIAPSFQRYICQPQSIFHVDAQYSARIVEYACLRCVNCWDMFAHNTPTQGFFIWVHKKKKLLVVSSIVRINTLARVKSSAIVTNCFSCWCAFCINPATPVHE